MSPYEKVRQKQKEEEERSDRLSLFCQKQGIVLIQISARRFIVAKVGGQSTMQQDETFYSCMQGVVVFGPDTWEACRKYIKENTPPTPNDLLPKGIRK